MRTTSVIAALTALFGISSVATAATARSNAPAAMNASANAGKSALDQGMEADAVVRLLGQPEEVKPMQAPQGKAEAWTYRRVLNTTVRQSAAAMQMVPAFTGQAIGTGQDQTRAEILYKMEHVTTYQVTQLLMFNDTLVTAKQWMEQRRDFE